mmetsp:Transcript_28282/g.49731  ORF Transcript_28282/g.49731 Transcript_28282/m.49731 type:complete len:365 (-) Transcript_28282:121-1215(-)
MFVPQPRHSRARLLPAGFAFVCVLAAALFVMQATFSARKSGLGAAADSRRAVARLRGGGGCYRSNYVDSAGFYGDFGTKAKFLLNGKDGDKFSTESNVNLTATGDDLVLVATKTFADLGGIRFSDDATAATSDSFAFRHSKNFNGNFDGYVQLSPAGSLSVGATASKKMGDGNLDTRITTGGSSVTAETRYTSDNVKATAALSGITEKGAGQLHASAAVGDIGGLHGVTFGGQVFADTASGAVTGHSVGAKYANADYTITGAVEGTDTLSASVHKDMNSDTSLAASAGYNINSKASSAVLGVEHQLDGKSSVSGRVDMDGNLGVAYRRKLRAGVEVRAAAGMNLYNLDAKPKTGVQLRLGTDFE